jgi:long-chain fatty acid transport protein
MNERCPMRRFVPTLNLPSLVVYGSIACVFFPAQGSSGGFQNMTQSATASAVATAGEAAIAEDAATVFYNPAGMSLLQRPQALAATGIGFPQSSFRNRGTTDALNNPVVGNDNVASNPFFLPSFFAVTPITERLHIGFGGFIPFGQVAKYSNNWVGRYQVQQTTLKTYDIDPAIAYKVSEWFAVGAGIDFQVVQFDRRNAIDFGAACLVGLSPATCARLGLAPQQSDGRLVARLDDWNVGYNVGALLQPSSATHFGASYRSSVKHDLSGTAEFTVPPAALPLTTNGIFQNTSAAGTLRFPDTLSLGVSEALPSGLTMLAGFNWTFWSQLNRLSLLFSNPAQPTLSQRLNWHDSFRISVGGKYRLEEFTNLRAGFAFDQSPIPSAFRTADLSGADTIELAAGFDHRISEQVTIALSYAYDRAMGAPLNLPVSGAGILSGTVHSSYHSIGLQINIEL